MARDRDVRRDRAGTGPAPTESGSLVPIGDLDDYRIAEGEPDVRGWDVRTVGGRTLGKVDDLLVDTVAGQVVMLDIEIDGTDEHARAPLRVAHLDRDAKAVILDSADLDRMGEASRRVAEERPLRTSATVEERRDDRDEIVIERRPTEVEEVVVRRKRLDEGDRES